ncbi:hypothetical protein [Candidatus Protochlamydia amoebophila]|uniref:hypothetical protein n=1 Tax=Candidatus Protochlamydia amoebophila TaxID=362787 RepID=UPI0015EFA4BB|nr:hypothetical protein [Candidatus Protochlamydia amoebophila]
MRYRYDDHFELEKGILKGFQGHEIEQNIDREIIKSENFSKESLEKHSFTDCTFNSCDFSETIQRNAKFNRALSRIAISVL